MSLSGATAVHEWRNYLRRLEAELRGGMNSRFSMLNRALDQSFADGERHARKNAAHASAAALKAQEAFDKALALEEHFETHLTTPTLRICPAGI